MRIYGLGTLLPALLAVSASFLPASAQTSPAALTQSVRPQADRISAAADLATRVRLTGHLPTWASSTADRGAIPDNTQLHLIITLSRSPQLQAAFDQLTADQQNPSSPRFHQWLTPQQIGEQFGPTQNDLASVSNWLTGQGLHVDSITPSRVYLQASASAAVVSAAFQTSLHTFAFGTHTLQAPTSEPSIPAGLQPVVSYISGLAPADRHRNLSQAAVVPVAQAGIRLPGAPAAPHSNVDLGSGVHWLLPADFATIYDLNPAYSASLNGTAEKIMIIGGSRLLASDVTSWESISDLPSYQPNYIVPTGTGFADPGITSDDNQGEGTLDFERAYGTAPGATIDQIISTNWLDGTTSENLILYAINTVNDPILSMSFGSCEAQQTPAYVKYESSVFQQAAAQGISVFASSGDSGVAGCEQQGQAPPATQMVSISDICASPYVTCVGGTQFSDTASPASYWASTNSTTNNSSALSYIPEGVWNEPSGTNSNGQTIFEVAAGGGGFSTVIAKPSFQVATGVPADGARDVPDISFTASTHNAFLACLAYAKADCTQYVTGFGGTSASAPSMAGITALLDQKLGVRQGNVNPLLYKLYASSALSFHDATPASSGVASCSTATATTCNNSNASPTALTGGIAGYALTSGFDLATGLGSLDVSTFLTAAGSAPTLAATSSSVTASPSTIASGQSAVFTATVASATAGTPSGTVQFSINGSPSGTPINLVGATASSASIPFNTPGTYTIAAAYSGDTVYAASTKSISFVVTGGSVTPTYSLSAATASLTLASGSSASGTDVITASTTNGFAGTISFTCSVALTSGAAAAVAPTCSLSPAMGTITSPATSTSTTASIATVAPHAVAASRSSLLRLVERGGTLAVAGLLLFTLPLTRRRSRWTALAGVFLLTGALFGLSGCGSSSSSTGGGTGGTTLTGGTTTGAYTVTVTGNASGLPATSTTFTLTVN